MSFHTFSRRFFKPKTPKCLPLLHLHLNRHFQSHINIIPKCPTNTNSSHSNPTSAQILATHLLNCTNLQELNQIYTQIIRTQMLDLYHGAFQWNNVMRSYVRHELPFASLRVYILMSRSGVSPDSYTIPIVLKAVCRVLGDVNGQQFHSVAIKNGLESDEFCESGLISMYSKGGEIDNARKVFEQNLDRKLGSWNAIIGGLAQGGHAKEAINMFIELRKDGFAPDDVTMVSVTSACGSLGDLDLAFQLHKCVFQAKTLEKSDILMSNSLIDMYGKCGRMDLAYNVFEKTVHRDVSTWTSLITGFAMHGYVTDALECFEDMREARVRPNNVTFVGVLSACVHGGMVEEGKRYFDMMKQTYGISPTMQHYGVMVDLLGKAGLLQEAKEMVERMPVTANAVIWGALMGGCEKHGNVEMGEFVARKLEELEPWNDGVYVVLSNIYARAGLWEEVGRVREIMKQRKVSKTPGYSLRIPKAFINHFPKESGSSVQAILEGPSGCCWHVKLKRTTKAVYLEDGWETF